jgi:hypothetical protein
MVVGKLPTIGLPKVKKESDIYKVGTICQSKAIHDLQNPFSPYVLNLFPQRKAEIASFIDPVQPLARVEVNMVNDPSKLEADLKPEELVIFQFIR